MDPLTTALLGLLLVAVPTVLWRLSRRPRMSGPHPFRALPDSDLDTAARYVYKWKERKKLLRAPFSPEAAEAGGPYEAIVIGSGIGGLTVAAILAKMGKRVLVLEQNNQLGGCCHTFNHKGYEFDVGIHYIGHMHAGHLDRFLIDQLTEGRLEWQELAPQFDAVLLGGGQDAAAPARTVPIGRTLRDSEAAIAQHFPEDAAAVHEFFREVRACNRSFIHFLVVKALPLWLVRLLGAVGFFRWGLSFFRRSERSLGDYLAGITRNPALRTTLAYCFGDYGVAPRNASISLHAGLWAHFGRGAFYPVGGASEITMTLLRVVRDAGGQVFGKARVSEILCDDAGRAVGVRLLRKVEKAAAGADGDAPAAPAAPAHVDIRAPVVVSAAGAINTAAMLPEEVRKRSRLPRPVDELGPGCAAIQVFVGLNNSAEELGITAQNVWAFPQGDRLDVDAAVIKMEEFSSLDDFMASEAEFPFFFASFPSAKDPLWERRAGKPCSTCTIITLAPWPWFLSWRKSKVKKRGAEYDGLKTSVGRRLWEQLCSLMPPEFGQRADVELMEIGTPLTNNHYLGSTRGEIYGLDHTVARFADPGLGALLRPDVGVDGLVLAGQDVMTCGFAGAMLGGVMAASEVTGRNLLLDAMRMKKEFAAAKPSRNGNAAPSAAPAS